jgi:spore coat polysaccharide biosynthesis predicted glycosyltransferase SpsG
VAYNQLRIASQLDEAGAAVDLGSIDDLGSDSLPRELSRLIDDHDLRMSMSARGRELVDGNGASRAVAEMLSLIR